MTFKEFYDKKQPQEIFEKEGVKIFCDMDRVLCDFEKAVFDIDGKTTIQDIEKLPEKTFWNYIQKAKGGLLGFFANMKWTKDGKQLWQYIKGMQPTILSAVKEPGRDDAIKGKNTWLNREIGNVPRLFVKREDKQKYAKGNILIDDWEKNIKEWTEAGGKAIHYKNGSDAIKQLKELTENIVIAPYYIVPDKSTQIDSEDK